MMVRGAEGRRRQWSSSISFYYFVQFRLVWVQRLAEDWEGWQDSLYRKWLRKGLALISQHHDMSYYYLHSAKFEVEMLEVSSEVDHQLTALLRIILWIQMLFAVVLVNSLGEISEVGWWTKRINFLFQSDSFLTNHFKNISSTLSIIVLTSW